MAIISDDQLIVMFRERDDCVLDFARAIIEVCAKVCDRESEGPASTADGETIYGEDDESAKRCAEAIRRLNG